MATAVKKNKKTVAGVKKNKRVTRPLGRKPVKKTPTKKAKGITTEFNIFILDSSSSMSAVQDVTRSGLNEQIATIQSLAKEGALEQVVALYVFADKSEEKLFKVPADQIKPFGEGDYVPLGNTALNDCIGRAVNRVRADLGDRKDTAVVLTILTDGDENASKEFTTAQIKALLTEVQEKDKWTVTYIGANQNLAATRANYNLSPSNMVSYTSNAAGTTAVFNKLREARSSNTAKLNSYGARGMSVNSVGFDNTKMFNKSEQILRVDEDGNESVDNSAATTSGFPQSTCTDFSSAVRNIRRGVKPV